MFHFISLIMVFVNRVLNVGSYLQQIRYVLSKYIRKCFDCLFEYCRSVFYSESNLSPERLLSTSFQAPIQPRNIERYPDDDRGMILEDTL